jgi:hypothetical protein
MLNGLGVHRRQVVLQVAVVLTGALSQQKNQSPAAKSGLFYFRTFTNMCISILMNATFTMVPLVAWLV